MGELYNPYPKLPRNIRQIGEKDEVVRLYLEDYVNTYLKRLYPQGGQDLRVGLLLGSSEMQEEIPCIFIDGAMEMEGVTAQGERVEFTEAAWKKAYQSMEETFPKRTVQGWFLCGGQGSQLSPLNYWKQHIQYFSGKNQIMYLNSGMEGEEAIYMTSEDGFYRLRGHSIYYERNQMMQDYMILRKDARRVESGSNDQIVRDFRNKMQDRKLEAQKKRTKINMLGGACGALSLALMAGGVVMVNNYSRMKEMEAVLVSVLPSGYEGWDGESGEKMVIENISGGVSPKASPGAGKENAGGKENSPGKEQAAEVVRETMAQGGNATAGKDYVTPDGEESGGRGEPPASSDNSGGGESGSLAGGAESSHGAAAPQNGSQNSDNGGAGGTARGSGGGTSKASRGSGGETAEGSAAAEGGSEMAEASRGSSGEAAEGSAAAESGSETPKASHGSGGEAAEDSAAAGNGSSEAAAPHGSGDDGDGDEDSQAGKGNSAGQEASSGATLSDLPVNAKGQRIYTIQEGETLHGICYKFYHTINRLPDLCEANGIEDVDKIISGTQLIIPE